MGGEGGGEEGVDARRGQRCVRRWDPLGLPVPVRAMSMAIGPTLGGRCQQMMERAKCVWCVWIGDHIGDGGGFDVSFRRPRLFPFRSSLPLTLVLSLSCHLPLLQAEIRKAYLRLAVRLHPDKNRDCADAALAFQALQRAYGVLSDAERRAVYDETGVVTSADGEAEGEDGWAAGVPRGDADALYHHYRKIYKRVAEEDIKAYYKAFRGSEQERDELVALFVAKGSMKAVFQHLPCSSTARDSHRFATLLEEAAARGEVHLDAAFRKWAAGVRRKPAPDDPLADDDDAENDAIEGSDDEYNSGDDIESDEDEEEEEEEEEDEEEEEGDDEVSVSGIAVMDEEAVEGENPNAMPANGRVARKGRVRGARDDATVGSGKGKRREGEQRGGKHRKSAKVDSGEISETSEEASLGSSDDDASKSRKPHAHTTRGTRARGNDANAAAPAVKGGVRKTTSSTTRAKTTTHKVQRQQKQQQQHDATKRRPKAPKVDTMADLAAAIAARRARANDFADVIAKYGGKGGKKGGKGRTLDEPSEEEFAAARARVDARQVAKSKGKAPKKK